MGPSVHEHADEVQRLRAKDKTVGGQRALLPTPRSLLDPSLVASADQGERGVQEHKQQPRKKRGGGTLLVNAILIIAIISPFHPIDIVDISTTRCYRLF